MDGTLLDNIPAYFDNNHTIYIKPIARPHLDIFMKYVFNNFERISIWTAASKIWYNNCYENVLKHYIPEGKSFHFVKTKDDYDSSKFIKPLSLIYAQYPDVYNPSNTLIVDDNRITYVENIANAIPIKSFYYDRLPREIRKNIKNYDSELLLTIQLINKKNNNEPNHDIPNEENIILSEIIEIIDIDNDYDEEEYADEEYLDEEYMDENDENYIYI
jgi:hypothetical protein